MTGVGSTTPMPDPFLEVRVCKLDLDPTLRAACAGYEAGKWRDAQFAAHLMEWLPEFALDPLETSKVDSANAVKLLRRAAYNVYTSNKYKKRGEFGEILLHALLRQTCASLPAISKVYFKSAANNTVKGFDAVHVVGQPGELELWLGEVKFYNDLNGAVRDVLDELDAHLDADYLRGEFISVTNKLDDRWPHAAELNKLLDPNTSLDVVFRRLCVPVLLTYDSACVAKHTAVCDQYLAEFSAEVRAGHKKIRAKLAERSIPADVRVHVLLVPLRNKADLVALMDQELKKWQPIN